jgi:MFS family permease
VTAATRPPRTGWFQRFSLAFGIPGYPRYFTAMMLSRSAYMLVSLSQGWLILQLTNSPFWVGLGVGLLGASQTLFSVPMGAVADRLDRRRILLAAFACSAALLATVGLLTLAGAIRPWHMLVFMSLLGLLIAAERPATTGLLYDLVGPDRLLNASAFRFMGYSLMHVASALAGGVVLQRLGPGQNFMIGAAGYLGGLAILLLLPLPGLVARSVEPFTETVVAGLRYAVHMPPIRRLLLMSVVVEGFGFAYGAMLPVLARDVLRVDGLGLGYLAAMSGVGTFAATVAVAARGDVRRKHTLLVASAVGFGLFVMLFGLSRVFVASLVLVAVAHVLGGLYDVTMVTVLPAAASDAMRGRVLGLFVATVGFSQLGGLGVGTLAAEFGAPLAVAIAGGLTSGGALLLGRGIRGPTPLRQEEHAPPNKA